MEFFKKNVILKRYKININKLNKNMKNKFYINKKISQGIFVVAGLFVFLITTNVNAAGTDDFMITVKTDNVGSSLDTQFTIPTTGAG